MISEGIEAPIDIEIDRIPQCCPRKAVVSFRCFEMERYNEINIILCDPAVFSMKQIAQSIDFYQFNADQRAGETVPFDAFVLRGSMSWPQADDTDFALHLCEMGKLRIRGLDGFCFVTLHNRRSSHIRHFKRPNIIN